MQSGPGRPDCGPGEVRSIGEAPGNLLDWAGLGVERQHLPLAAITRTIEINMLQYVNEAEVPPILEPVDDVLC